MGQEFGDKSPFLYFVSHTDDGLVEAVREGRKSEFRGFEWENEPPDPQAEDTFESSKIKWNRLDDEQGRGIFGLYKELAKLRGEKGQLRGGSRESIEAYEDHDSNALVLRRFGEDKNIVCCFNFRYEAVEVKSLSSECFEVLVDSSDERWGKDKSRIKEQEYVPDGNVNIIIEARNFKVFEMEK
jgi:maltooligosyltrehalose trehalohydrolase